jgi:hypothetical protein
MKFKLPDFDCSKYPKVYAGTGSRYATATAVAYVSNNQLLAAQFLNRTIYLLNLEHNGSHTIVSSTKTTYYPDLMDYKGGLIATANFPSLEFADGSLSLFRLEGSKIVHDKDIVLKGMRCHGCRIIDENTVIVTNTGDNNRGLLFVNTNTGSYELFDDFLYYPKDILIRGNSLYISSSASRPNLKPVEILDSILYRFNKSTLEKESELVFHGQTDAIAVDENDIFITLQGQHCLAYLTDLEEIKFVGYIGGYDFPHGIASKAGNICVSNYGDNTIDIQHKTTLIQKQAV